MLSKMPPQKAGNNKILHKEEGIKRLNLFHLRNIIKEFIRKLEVNI